MGVSTSVEEFTNKVSNAGRNLQQSRVPSLNAAALAAKNEMLRGAPRFLRGVGRRGAKIGVRYTLYGESKAIVRWVGPAHLANNPTKPHEIRPKGKRRRNGKRALVINGTPVARAQHPGTRGKHFYEASKPRVVRAVQASSAKSARDAVARAFK